MIVQHSALNVQSDLPDNVAPAEMHCDIMPMFLADEMSVWTQLVALQAPSWDVVPITVFVYTTMLRCMEPAGMPA